jgi:hypothetical protein
LDEMTKNLVWITGIMKCRGEDIPSQKDGLRIFFPDSVIEFSVAVSVSV